MMAINLNFDTIMHFYSNNYWDKGMIWDSVAKNKITQDEYTKITEDTYPIERPNNE